jgi:hypothetical protein
MTDRDTHESSVAAVVAERDKAHAEAERPRNTPAVATVDPLLATAAGSALVIMTRERDSLRAEVARLRGVLDAADSDLAREVVALDRERDGLRAEITMLRKESVGPLSMMVVKTTHEVHKLKAIVRRTEGERRAVMVVLAACKDPDNFDYDRLHGALDFLREAMTEETLEAGTAPAPH